MHDVVHLTKLKFVTYEDLLDHAFSQFNETLLTIEIQYNQIENDERPCTEYTNENDSEAKITKINKPSAIPNFMPQILADDEIAQSVNSISLK